MNMVRLYGGCFLLALFFGSGLAWGLDGGNGGRGGKKGQRQKSYKDAEDAYGDWSTGARWEWPDGKFRKWPLPPEAQVRELDTRVFDARKPSLNLTKDQEAQVTTVFEQVQTERHALKKAQDEARQNYQKAPAKPEPCVAAARELVRVMENCRNFRPEDRFAEALKRILSEEQWLRYSAP